MTDSSDFQEYGDEPLMALPRTTYLNRLLLILAPVSALIVFLRAIFSQSIEEQTVVLQFGIPVVVMVFIAYCLSRTRYVVAGTWLLVVLVLAVSYSVSIYLLDPQYLSFMSIASIVSLVILSYRSAIVVNIVTVLLVVIAPVIVPVWSYPSVTNQLTLVSVIIIVNIGIGGLLKRNQEILLKQANALVASERQRILYESQKEHSEFLQQLITDLSHEVKTPLSTLNTSAYLLRKSQSDEARTRHLDVIEYQSKNLDKIAGDLLKIVRLRDATQTHFEQVRLKTLFEFAEAAMLDRAKQKEIDLQFIVDKQATSVPGDIRLLKDALGQLIENAVQFTPSGGKIRVKCVQNGAVHIMISDSGVGIQQDELEKIFAPFYKVDKSRTGNDGNTGLGLTIVQRTIELHGGQIEIESTPGIGTTFTIILPVEGDTLSTPVVGTTTI